MIITISIIITIINTITTNSRSVLCPDDAVHDVLQEVGEDVHVRGEEGAGLDLVASLVGQEEREQEEEEEVVEVEVEGWS